MPELEEHLQDMINIIDSSKMLEDLAITVMHINEQIAEIERESTLLGCSIYRLQDAQGVPVLSSLLVAKVHAMNAIATLKATEQYAQNYVIQNFTTTDGRNG